MKQKKEKEEFVRCFRKIEKTPRGVVIGYHDIKTGTLLARKFMWVPGYRRTIDLRDHPLFLTLSPCPYCGTLEDKGHQALSHIDTRFGRFHVIQEEQ